MRNKSMEDNVIISQVEKFISDLHCGNIQIMPKAQHLQLCQKEKNGFGITTKKEEIGTLAFLLGQAISAYEQNRNNPLLKLRHAQELSEYIEWAYTHKVIKETKLTEKYEAMQKENQQLNEKIDKLQKENQKLHAELKRWGKIGFVSDLGKDKEE
jgi:FtsZ-binding cell division protein ZapB